MFGAPAGEVIETLPAPNRRRVRARRNASPGSTGSGQSYASAPAFPVFNKEENWNEEEPFRKEVYLGATKDPPKLAKGREYLLWDIGSPGNISGSQTIQDKAKNAMKHKRLPAQRKVKHH